MKKKALLALMLVVTMLLSGCALIEKDTAVEGSTVVIRVYDQEFTKAEVETAVNYELEYMYYVYQMFGMYYDVTDPANIAAARESVVAQMVEDVVIRRKVTELGMDQLTADEEAQVNTNVEAAMNNYRFQVQQGYFANSGLTGDALTAEVDKFLNANGVTVEAVTAEERHSFWVAKMRASVMSGATFTEDDVLAHYNGLVAEEKATYDANPEQYATNVNNGIKTYYRPEGYRMVKQILIKFSDEDANLISGLTQKKNDAKNNITNLTQALSGQDQAEVERLKGMVTVEITIPEGGTALDAEVYVDAPFPEGVDAVMAEQVKQLAISEAGLVFFSEQLDIATANATAKIDAEADDVIAQLEAGADWDTLMLAVTDDPGMQADSITSETGYAVCANLSTMDPAFVDAAMAIPEVGGISPKTPGVYGYYVIKYVADVEPGEIGLETIRPQVETTVLSQAQNKLYDETLAKWVSEANAWVNWDEINK